MEYFIKEKTVFNESLAASWAEFVDCPERLKTLSSFLEMHLSKHKQGLIFDAALGIGCESIFLKKMRYNVISNEIDDTLIKIALESAIEYGVNLQITQQDWRELEFHYSPNYFEGIINLGNSLCLLETLEDIRLTLKNFYNTLKQGGTLIVDERNFPYILEHKEEILSGNFRYSGKYIYCGKIIKGVPIKISNSQITFGYFKGKNLLGSLKMYPFIKDELRNLLLDAGFKSVIQYSDFKVGQNNNADFFIYVASK